jgi:hypothetical protein
MIFVPIAALSPDKAYIAPILIGSPESSELLDEDAEAAVLADAAEGLPHPTNDPVSAKAQSIVVNFLNFITFPPFPYLLQYGIVILTFHALYKLMLFPKTA